MLLPSSAVCGYSGSCLAAGNQKVFLRCEVSSFLCVFSPASTPDFKLIRSVASVERCLFLVLKQQAIADTGRPHSSAGVVHTRSAALQTIGWYQTG